MAINVTVKESEKEINIAIKGHFDFSQVQEFRNAYQDYKGYYATVDMREVEYMDSSGLGMLLNMANHLGPQKELPKLMNCRAAIKKVLLISRFDRKFIIT